MRYDLLYILPSQTEETPSEEIKNKINEYLKAINATIIRDENLGRRKLAYPIENQRHGYYGNIIFEAESPLVPRLKEMLSLETAITRFQIIQEEHTVGKKGKRRARPRRFVHPTPTPSAAPKITEKVSLEELDKKLEELISKDIT
ncbi:MAG: 30S ribosomal protein S6 [Patescibacteria group bacterium]